MYSKGLNKEPIIQDLGDVKHCKCSIPLIINIISLVVFTFSLICFILSLVFLKNLHIDRFLNELYLAVIVLLSFSCLCFVVHIIYFFIKSKRCIRSFEIFLVAFYILFILILAIVQFSIHGTIMKRIKDFWWDPSNLADIIEYEKQFKCCGYNRTEDRCHLPTAYRRVCQNVIVFEFMHEQVAIASTQLVFAIILFLFLLIMVLRAAHVKKQRAKRSHKERIDSTDREEPLNPDYL
ncbi:hypothetical protein TRFO_23222 [Tritrichomonas foetus]|uniref:Tetraspanin family protein n=1 Tax=Tritrichomonas foetus TaxID=1144522 RepID=A0A1J4K9Y1_9EUKA|nr:hypothetical protein TRFO_23222 [Tritrichomonas foetus]|eukprot:OHT08239.1 hypothetical protein TRFO_23222 [Tritrichomonas foetus]